MAKTKKNCLNGDIVPTQNTSAHDTSDLTFCDIVAIILERFEIEKNAKNNAYAFILTRGLLEDYQQFNNDLESEPFEVCLTGLMSNLNKKTK